ncbi:MAG: PDZ domain-containing protein [Candidatus Eisenbacteria bacterium]
MPSVAPPLRPAQRRLLAPLLAAALASSVAVLLAGCRGGLPAGRSLRLRYDIVVAHDAGHGAQVTVTELRGAGNLRLLLPPSGVRRRVEPLARDAGADAKSPATLAYRASAPETPHGGPGFACYRGFELLAQPAGIDLSPEDSITLDFRLEAGQSVVAPLAALAADPLAPHRGPITIGGDEFMTLLQSYIALGDYGVRVLPGVPGRLPPIVWGRRRIGGASEGELIDVVQRLLTAHVEQFGPDRPTLPYSVVVDYPYEGHGFAGNATGRSIDLRLSRDEGIGSSPGLLRLTAHELAHFWLGGAFAFPKPEDHWFVEGAADYFGLVARVRAGYLDAAHAGDELAEQWATLTGNRWLQEPIEDLGRSYAGDVEAFTASYARGAIATWALEWRARLSGRPSIEALLRTSARDPRHAPMRELLIAHLRGPGWKPGALGADAGADAAALLSDDPVDTFVRILGEAGLQLGTRPTRELTFGLERFEPGTTKLLAVPSGSPAQSAGVRAGDRVREVDGLPVDDTMQLQNAMERSYARPAYKLDGMEVTYERAGSEDRVRLFAAPQSVPIVLDRGGGRAESVLP